MERILWDFSSGWTLTLAENREVVKRHFDPKTADELKAGGFTTVPASVPGNFELDLFRAGLIDDPFRSTNMIALQELENRHLWYLTSFETSEDSDENTFLRFDGIDTAADIFLDGTLLGHTENMLIGYSFPVPGMKKGTHCLLVHIYPFMIYSRKYINDPLTSTFAHSYAAMQMRKAPSMLGWDIMPRFVSGGIWKKVALVQKPKERFEQVFLYTRKVDPVRKAAAIGAYFELHSDADSYADLRVCVEGRCGDSVFRTERRPWHNTFNTGIWAENAKLWYPKNAGEHPLYDVTVTLKRGEEILDTRTLRFGIRTVELQRTSVTDKDGNGEFVFRINGKKVFAMGTNWVPLDAFHSRDIENLPRALAMLEDLGCNIVRCWGGNVYENDEFYDFCDAHGIMVWQDFAMGCAVYPQDERFRAVMREEAAEVVKRLRNHPSILLWAGDNECDFSSFWNTDGHFNPNDNLITRVDLPLVCRTQDFTRPYLPSSPYVDEYAFRNGRDRISEDHLWGPRDYFKGDYYRNTVCHFASETGYHGCPSPESLKKFIRPDHLFPNVVGGKTDEDWLVHGTSVENSEHADFSYRIKLMTSQVETLFGRVPDDLDTYAKMSQISQAEAKKYFIERFRLSKWRRTGIIWWNLIDGWPQISDAIVDYYGTKKLAYHFIRRTQNPLCLMLDEPEDGTHRLFAVNDLQKDETVRFRVTDLSDGSEVLTGTAEAKADSSVPIGLVPCSEKERILLIEWETETGVRGVNHYTEKTRGIDYDTYAEQLKKAGFDEFEGF